MAPDVQDLMHRLERVERENRRIKLGGLVILTLGAMFMFTGLTVDDPVVGAEAFTLVDDRGEPRAVFALVNAQPTLALFDTQSKVRVELSVVEDSPRLILYGDDGNPIWSAP